MVILVPPAAPATIRTSPLLSTKIAGADEDIGRLPGKIKFAEDGSTPNAFFTPGVEKSSISLLNMIPVRVPRYLQPKLKQKTSPMGLWLDICTALPWNSERIIEQTSCGCEKFSALPRP